MSPFGNSLGLYIGQDDEDEIQQQETYDEELLIQQMERLADANHRAEEE